jgi:hypothetical protein
MEMEDYYEKAVKYYESAKELSPNDYRAYWFLGHHYSLSAVPDKALKNFAQALNKAPNQPHEAFWGDYAMACSLTGMIANAQYAAHQSSLTAGYKTNIETQVNILAKNLIKSLKSDTTLAAKDLWKMNKDEGAKISFSNFVMGARIAVDSNWHLDLGRYEKRASYATITPGAETSQKGKKITYSILTFMKLAEKGQTLQQFIDIFTARYSSRRLANINSPIPDAKVISYEIIEPKVYPENGGAHIYAVAFERDMPQFPGAKLELPFDFLNSAEKNGEIHYYTAKDRFSRVNGKIFYLVLLDTCEDINKKSIAVFNDFLTNRFIVE